MSSIPGNGYPVPSAAPTAGPTAYGMDCTRSCAVVGQTSVYPANFNSFGPFVLANYFTISFQIKNPTGLAGNYKNVFRLTDTVTNAEILAFYMYGVLDGYVLYSGSVGFFGAALFDASYQTVFTTITISVTPTLLVISSDRGSTVSVAYGSNVPTYGRAYTLTMSGLGTATSGGEVRSVSITGKSSFGKLCLTCDCTT